MDRVFNSMRYSGECGVRFSDKRIRALIELSGKGNDVLDLGCGDGALAEMIRAAGNKVTGIDVSGPAIEKARSKGIRVYDNDLNTEWAGLIEEKFDAVVCGEVIEHIFDTDRFLRNIYAVLKEEGRLILSTPNLAALGRRLFLLLGINPHIELTARKEDAGHIRYFTPGSLRRLLKENGFEVISSRSDYMSFYTQGRMRCAFLARLFPALGNSLIVECRKLPKDVQHI